MAKVDYAAKSWILISKHGTAAVSGIKELGVQVQEVYWMAHGPMLHDLIIIVADGTFELPQFPEVYRYMRDQEKKIETTTFSMHLYLFTEKEATENRKLQRYLNIPFE